MASISISDEDWAALSDEIAALTRAGVPLEAGLAGLGPELAGALGAQTDRIAQRLRAGRPLSQAVADPKDRFSLLLAAAVQAGAAADRLPEFLALFAQAARRIAELRGVVASAVVYPLLLAAASYAFMLTAFFHLTPSMLETFTSMGFSTGSWSARYAWAAGHWLWWAPLPPVLLAAVASSVRASTRVGRSGGPVARLLRRPQGLSRLWRLGERAIFTELVALLLDQQIPMPQALQLAGAASADESLRLAASKAQAEVEQGGSGEEAGFPPLLQWALTASTTPQRRVDSLRRTAAIYREELERRAESLQLWLPVAWTAIVGGAATAALALYVFSPMFYLLLRIAEVE